MICCQVFLGENFFQVGKKTDGGGGEKNLAFRGVRDIK